MARAGTPRIKPSRCRRRNSSKTTRATSKISPTVSVGRISRMESKNCQKVGGLGSVSIFNSPVSFLHGLQPKWQPGMGYLNHHPIDTSCFMFIKACCFSKICNMRHIRILPQLINQGSLVLLYPFYQFHPFDPFRLFDRFIVNFRLMGFRNGVCPRMCEITVVQSYAG